MLEKHGVPVTQVSAHTGFPEIMDGRVKTLHPKIHGGLLGRRGIDDDVMRQHGIEAIDLVVVNLYPFAATIAKPDCTYEDAIENIDIGGPAMVRAAAKNHDRVTVIVDPQDYPALLEEIDDQGGVSLDDAQAPRRKSVRAHRELRRSGRELSRARVTESAAAEYPDSLALQLPQAPRSALRRKSASDRRVLRGARRARREHRQRDTAAGQDAVVQQHRRRRHGVRMRAPVR